MWALNWDTSYVPQCMKKSTKLKDRYLEHAKQKHYYVRFFSNFHKLILPAPTGMSSLANIHYLKFAENFSTSQEVLNSLSSTNLLMYDGINIWVAAHDGITPINEIGRKKFCMICSELVDHIWIVLECLVKASGAPQERL